MVLKIQRTGDRLPDYAEYCDEGCDLSPSCLNCPLPRCRHDRQPQGRRAARVLRDAEIIRQHTCEGKGTSELAQDFKVSKRTIQRIIRRSKNDSADGC